MGEPSTVYTMPLEDLRVHAREARRLIAQAREIARMSLEARRDERTSSPEEVDASRRAGLLLDAAERLLPGMPSLGDERASTTRAKAPESGWRRVTLRGGPERALDALERGRILEDVADDAAVLVAEIARRSSSVFRAADVTPTLTPVATRDRATHRS